MYYGILHATRLSGWETCDVIAFGYIGHLGVELHFHRYGLGTPGEDHLIHVCYVQVNHAHWQMSFRIAVVIVGGGLVYADAGKPSAELQLSTSSILKI